jgi:hypothetical protein
VPDLAQGNARRANLYQFSLNNPLRYLDPDGREPSKLKELARWPQDAHHQWKRLTLAERIAVLERMGRYYGRDFAAKFLHHTPSPTLENIHDVLAFPERSPKWFQDRGYRLAQTSADLDSVIEWWVHPSGKEIMKIRELHIRLASPPPPDPLEIPEPVERSRPVVDPPPPDFPQNIPDPVDYSRPVQEGKIGKPQRVGHSAPADQDRNGTVTDEEESAWMVQQNGR